jgi:hypothetical protein
MRYRIAVWVTGVACFAGLGAWSATSMASPTAASGAFVGGLLLGGLLGVAVSLLFQHALESHEVRTPHRVRARHTTRLH